MNLPTAPRALRRLSLAFAMLSIGLFGFGCQIVDQDRMRTNKNETIPWNERADWEDATLGVPY